MGARRDNGGPGLYRAGRVHRGLRYGGDTVNVEENTLELIPTDEGFVAVVTHPDGEMHTFLMTMEQFDRLKRELDEDQS